MTRIGATSRCLDSGVRRFRILRRSLGFPRQVLTVLQWLCYEDRGEEAFAILVKHHGGGERDHPMPIAEYNEMCQALQQEKEMKHRGLRLFLQTPANRKRLFILISLAIFGQWSGTGLSKCPS